MEDNKKHICKYCNKEFDSGRALGSHYLHCLENPNREKIINKAALSRSERKKKTKRILICEYCGKEYELYLSEHKYKTQQYKKCCSIKCSHMLTVKNSNKEELKQKQREALNKYYNSDTFINKSLHNRKQYICEYCGKEHTIKEYKSYKYCSPECSSLGKRKKLSEFAKERNFGGFVEESVNKCYQGWYHGIHCDSSWEFAFVLWNEYHNNSIKRYTSYLLYNYDNKSCKYYPDFIVNDKDIYEIKGYYSARAKAKHEQHPEVKLLLRKDMLPIIEEVVSIYGKDFMRLYE